MEKTSSGPDYDVTLSLRSFNIQDFLTNFEIIADDLIEAELTTAKNALGLNSVNIHSPTVKGVISLGNGFEMTATGIIAAPLLPSEAYKFYVIVQDFKEASSDTSHTTFAKPIAAIFAVFKGNSHTSLDRFGINRICSSWSIRDGATGGAWGGRSPPKNSLSPPVGT